MASFKEGFQNGRLIIGVRKVGNELGDLARRFASGGHDPEMIKNLEAQKEKLGAASGLYKEAKKSGVGVNEAFESLKGAHAEAAGHVESANSYLKGIKSQIRGERLGKLTGNKKLLVGIGAVAALGGLISYSRSNAREKRAAEVANRQENLQQMREDVAVLRAAQNGPNSAGQNTMMGMAPTPGDHAARVMSARNGAAAGIDTSNPPVDMNYQVVR